MLFQVAPKAANIGNRQAPPRCFNCSAPLDGRACCGQAADSHVPSVVQFVHQTVESLTHADSRLWRTLGLLWFKPGQLTLEFMEGRRASFLPPVKLYFVFGVIFFALVSLAQGRGALTSDTP
jgi:hypothetical protein